MGWRLLAISLCSTELLSASQNMNVAICNMDGVSDSVIAAAKAEADSVYSSAGVNIVWRTCDEFVSYSAQGHSSWFVIRLLNNKPPLTVGAASLDVMGKAFVRDRNGGAMADAYYQGILVFVEQHRIDPGIVLGFVMAHELGHLLLGPGHTPDGVMQAAWGQKQIDAMIQRWLKFSKDGARRIRQALETRTAVGR